MYGSTPERYIRKEYTSGWLWGVVLPLGAVALLNTTHGLSLMLLAAYALPMRTVYKYRQKIGHSAKKSLLYAFFCIVSKVSQAIGQAKYWLNRWQQKPATLIEYKHSVSSHLSRPAPASLFNSQPVL